MNRLVSLREFRVCDRSALGQVLGQATAELQGTQASFSLIFSHATQCCPSLQLLP